MGRPRSHLTTSWMTPRGHGEETATCTPGRGFGRGRPVTPIAHFWLRGRGAVSVCAACDGSWGGQASRRRGGAARPPSTALGARGHRGTYADVPHLLRDLDLHVAAVALLPSPLAALGAGAIVPQRLQALGERRDCR